MSKKTRSKTTQAHAATLPSAENAKWVGIGFLTAAIAVTIGVLLIIQVHIR